MAMPHLSEQSMPYARCTTSMDRRAWVDAANVQLPLFEAEASVLQKRAAEGSAFIREYPRMAHKAFRNVVDETYAEARMMLWRCIYYKAMREANRN